MANKKAAAKKKSSTGRPAVIPVTGTKHEKMKLTAEEWDEMDHHATIPHNVPTHVNVYESTGGKNAKRTLVGEEEYFFRHNGLIYQAIESTPTKRVLKIYEPQIIEE